MQMSTESETELTSSPSLRSGFHDESDKITDEFSFKMTINCSDDVKTDKSDEDFSFACVSVNESPVSAEDVFQNGKIKPIFPYFDRSVLFTGDSDDLPRLPPVKKVFVETEDLPPQPEGEGEVEGPYCVWNRKAVEASPEVCKKSNSTGFSKIWRFREMVGRSNSDGRDAFVFLNSSSPSTTCSKLPAPEKSNTTSEKKCNGEAKVAGGKGKAKKGKTGETASLSAHYVRNRAMREEGRRRSYLPYRPELFGFFTNVQGGLSRNVHPF